MFRKKVYLWWPEHQQHFRKPAAFILEAPTLAALEVGSRCRETPLTNLYPSHHQSCDTRDEIKWLGCHDRASPHLHDNSKGPPYQQMCDTVTVLVFIWFYCLMKVRWLTIALKSPFRNAAYGLLGLLLRLFSLGDVTCNHLNQVMCLRLFCICHLSGDYPAPRAVLTGHDQEVVCVSVCAELGLVISGAKGQWTSVFDNSNVEGKETLSLVIRGQLNNRNKQKMVGTCLQVIPVCVWQRVRVWSTPSQGTCCELWRGRVTTSARGSSQCPARATASSTTRGVAFATSALMENCWHRWRSMIPPGWADVLTSLCEMWIYLCSSGSEIGQRLKLSAVLIDSDTDTFY